MRRGSVCRRRAPPDDNEEEHCKGGREEIQVEDTSAGRIIFHEGESPDWG